MTSNYGSLTNLATKVLTDTCVCPSFALAKTISGHSKPKVLWPIGHGHSSCTVAPPLYLFTIFTYFTAYLRQWWAICESTDTVIVESHSGARVTILAGPYHNLILYRRQDRDAIEEETWGRVSRYHPTRGLSSFPYKKSTMVIKPWFFGYGSTMVNSTVVNHGKTMVNHGWPYGWTMVKNHGCFTMVQPYG